MNSTKLQAGEYEVIINGRTFWVARVSAINPEAINDNTWQLCELLTSGTEYWNHFATKREAMEAIARSN